MKYKIVMLILFIYIQTNCFAQLYSTYYIEFTPYARMSLNGNNTGDTKYWWEENPNRQCLEFNLDFNEGTAYDVVEDGYEQIYQTYWNKATRIMTNDDLGRENYLAVGWRYDKFDDGLLEVGFYGHRDHDENGNPRRIFEQLCSKVVFSDFDVKLAFTNQFSYVNIDGYALITIRDVETWDNNEEIEVKPQWGWYGDYGQYLPKNLIKIKVSNPILDRASFWDNEEYMRAEHSLKIAHTYIKKEFSHRTFTSQKLYLSHLCESTNQVSNYTDEENVPDSQLGSFLIIEGGGGQVYFIANEIIIGGNTEFQVGTPIYIGPGN